MDSWINGVFGAEQLSKSLNEQSVCTGNALVSQASRHI